VLLLVTMTLGVAIGSVPLSPAAVWGVIASHLAGHPHYSVADAIVWEIRLPRVLLAAVVGAALTTAGTVVQVLVRNALADPFLLGVSSGASVGATAVLLFGTLASLGVGDLRRQRARGAPGRWPPSFSCPVKGGRWRPPSSSCAVSCSRLYSSR
jgi:iron complex transport system permease protein